MFICGFIVIFGRMIKVRLWFFWLIEEVFGIKICILLIVIYNKGRKLEVSIGRLVFFWFGMIEVCAGFGIEDDFLGNIRDLKLFKIVCIAGMYRIKL